MKSLRESAPQRQSPTTAVYDVLELGAELADLDPYAGLSGAARELLKAYVVLADEYAALADRPGASWASDAEVAMRIGSSKSTVRRARSELAEAAHLRVEYVAPFHRLPSGEASLHGTNVVTVLALMGSATDANKGAPRAVSSSSRRHATPAVPEVTMGMIDEQFTPNQRRAIEALIDVAVAKSQLTMAGSFKSIYGDRLYALELEVSALTKEVRVLKSQQSGSGGAGNANGAGGSGAPVRGKAGAACAGPDENRVHIMPQLGDSPERSPTSSVEFVLPRAA